MNTIFSTLKWIDAPGSIPVLVLSGVLAVVLAVVWPRRRRVTLAWVTLVTVLYLVLAVPTVANGIAAGLPRVDRRALLTTERVDALVVFDGDNRRGRVREAMRIYRANAPATVWSLGLERWMKSVLLLEGIPPAIFHHDTSTKTTSEQVAWVGRLVQGNDRSVAIVASRLQMPRVAALLCASRVRARLAPSPADVEPDLLGYGRFVPKYAALRISRDALYEHMALMFYRFNGTIAGGPSC